MAAPSRRHIVVFSGGSAANSLVDVFNEVIEKNNCSLSYVIPISDNGGSSSELIRVFGGPGIGDVRSMSPEPLSTFSVFAREHLWESFRHECDYLMRLVAWKPIGFSSCMGWTDVSLTIQRPAGPTHTPDPCSHSKSL